MGAEPATRTWAPPQRGSDTARDTRSARLRSVGEVVRLYEDLERALRQTADADLARLVAASRAGERALGEWARRIEAMRAVKRRVESAAERAAAVPRAAAPLRAHVSWTLEEPRAVPFLWEALAFAVGLGVSLLLT
jgi:hypothetical protein